MTERYVNKLGVNPFQADSSREHRAGTRDCFIYSAFSKAVEAIYIFANGTLSAGQVCELPMVFGSDSYSPDTPLTKTNAATIADAQNEVFRACVPLVDLAGGEWGWVAVQGVIPILGAANLAAQTPLGLTATAGVVDDADTDYEVVNAYSIAAVGGAQALTDCFVPHDLIVKRNAA